MKPSRKVGNNPRIVAVTFDEILYACSETLFFNDFLFLLYLHKREAFS